MPKRNSPSSVSKRDRNAGKSKAEQSSSETSNSSEVAYDGIGRKVQWILSSIFVLHFMALLVALSSNRAPSYLQGELMNWLAPYLTTTHQSYGSIPLQLTHGEQVDFPLQVEWLADGDPNWQAEASLTQAGARWTSFARVIQVIGIDLPESEILSELGLKLVKQIEARESVAVREIRFVVNHVLSFDEDLAIATGREELLSDDRQPAIVFDAVVVRQADSPIGLIPQQDASRTSKAVSAKAFP